MGTGRGGGPAAGTKTPRLVAAVAWLLAGAVSPGEAAGAAKRFDIPAQDVQGALNEFARQSDRQILFSTEVTASKRTAGVRGELEPEAALKQLLLGTGLTYRVTAGKAILVEGPKTTTAGHRRLDITRAERALAQAVEADLSRSIEEIFVTATRRRESLREVPQSVTALPERTLERIQADDFQDYAKRVPGLQLSTPVPGESQLILRGLSSLNAASTTAVYVDDTPYGSSSGLANGHSLTPDLNAFDLQRIEVLRGPQGTLYGASTMGGVLKFVTNPPDRTQFAGRLQIDAKDLKGEAGWSARGMVNVPLSERSALRLTAVRNEQPGYIDDPTRKLENINATGSTGMRASLLLQVNDAMSVRVTSVAQDNDLDGANDVDLAVDTSDPVRTPLWPYRPAHGDLRHSRSLSETTQIEYRLHNATVNWHLGGIDLMSSTSYGTYGRRALLDATLLDGLIQTDTAELDRFTQEWQLTSQSDGRFDWIAGIYYTRELASIGQRFTNFVYDGSRLGVDSKFEELAAFATLTYEFTSRFDVAFGMRAARNEQQASQHGEGMFVTFQSSADSAEDVLLYSIAPRWRLSDDTTAYARVASGYRPGGPNIIPLGNPENAPRTYGSDTVLSLEAGIKTDLLDRRLSLDLSAFALRWKDLQLTGVVNDTSVMSNAGEARSAGFEWAAELRPLPGLTLDLIGACTDAVLTESTAAADQVDLLGGRDGDRLPYVSKWTALAGFNYEWPVLGAATAHIGAHWNYIGERRTDFGSSFGRQLTLPSYDTIDLRAGLDFEHWSIGLYGKNITDERGVASLGENSSPGGGGVFDADAFEWTFGSTFLVIRPRTFGLMLSMRW